MKEIFFEDTKGLVGVMCNGCFGRVLDGIARLFMYIFYDGPGSKLTVTQIHVWSVVIGAVFGVIITGYAYALEFLIYLIWNLGGRAVQSSGLNPYMMNWFVPLVYGGGLGGVMLMIAKRFGWECGSMVNIISGVHLPGSVPFKYFFPMFVISLVRRRRRSFIFLIPISPPAPAPKITITGGASCGPEAAVVVLGASATSLLSDVLLKQPMRQRRILTLCGMTASLAAFFGMPLTAAIFVLELPHHNGMEYYEALSPSVISSIVAAIINKLITQRPLGGTFNYLALPEQNYYSLLWAIVIGVIAGVHAFAFIIYVKSMKWMVQRTQLSSYPLLASLVAGSFIGLCGVLVPSVLFWGEHELQWAVQMGAPGVPLPYAASPGLIPLDTPMTMWQSYFVGMMKLLAIGCTVAVGWPGGIFFPLFMAAASLGGATAALFGIHPTIGITCFMAALEGSVLRTPWGAVLIVLLTQGNFSGNTSYLQTFPLMIISVTVAMIAVQWTRMYGDEQHGRRDMKPVEFEGDDPDITSLTRQEDRSLLLGDYEMT